MTTGTQGKQSPVADPLASCDRAFALQPAALRTLTQPGGQNDIFVRFYANRCFEG